MTTAGQRQRENDKEKVQSWAENSHHRLYPPLPLPAFNSVAAAKEEKSKRSPEPRRSRPRLRRHSTTNPFLVGYEQVEAIEKKYARGYQDAEREQPKRNNSVAPAQRQVEQSHTDPTDPIGPILTQAVADVIGLDDHPETDEQRTTQDHGDTDGCCDPPNERRSRRTL